MSTTTLITADQLLRMPRGGYRCELIAGEIRRMTPAGWKHGAVVGRLHGRLAQHVEQQGLGMIFGAETGFLLARDPDTVHAPDIAFVHRDRLPAAPPEDAFWPGAPDLAVEVVSPGDTVREVDEKVKAWLGAGAKLVWVISPAWRNVTVHRSAAKMRVLAEDEDLSGEDVVPQFLCRVGEIFAHTS